MGQSNKQFDGLDIGYLLNILLKYWYIFVLCACIGIAAGYYKVKTSLKIYQFKASLLIGQKITGSKYASGDELLNARMDKHEIRNVEDEMGIITALDNIRTVIAKNELGVSYFIEKNLRPEEVYTRAPYLIEVDSSKKQYIGTPIFVEFISENEVKLSIEAEESKYYSYLLDESEDVYNLKLSKKISLDQLEPTLGIKVRLRESYKDDFKPKKGIKHFFKLNPVGGLAKSYQDGVSIKPTAKETNLLILTLEGAVPQKQIDFLDTLMAVYINNDLVQKNEQGKLTLDFINKELAQAEKELRQAEGALETYKSQKAIPDIERMTSIESTNLETLKQEKKQLEARLLNFQNIYTYFIQNRNSDALVPTNYDSGDFTVNTLISSLVQKNQARASLIQKVKESHPSVISINAEITNIKGALKDYLENNINTARSKLNEVNKAGNKAYDKITTIPQDYRRIEDLERDFKFKKTQYEKLLEKQSEARIRLATNIPDNRVIDTTRMAGKGPVAPNSKLILLVALFISLAMPFVAIFAVKYLQGKISNKEDLLRNTDIPLLATIAHVKNKKKAKQAFPMVIETPRSVAAESFRLLKIEIDALLKPTQKPRIIGVGSSINREGKTFCASNLSCTFAQQGIKTLLLDADLYKGENLLPNLDPSKSLSEYALGKITVYDTIQPSGIDHLDIISSGAPLNNPSIFLQSQHFAYLIEEITSLYEVIIIDSPPLGFVSDFLVVEKYTHLNLFMMRVERSLIKYLDNLHELKEKKMLDNLYLVLNDMQYHSPQQLSAFGLIKRKNPYYHNQ